MIKKISSILMNKKKYDSYFDCTTKKLVLHELKCIILAIITLGFSYPWLICMSHEHKCSHTVICGKRLKFIGNPKELIGHWIFWWILILITFGLYGLVVKVRFEQWITANTIFEDTKIIN